MVPLWAATGFPDNSLAVPTKQDARLALCGTLKAYFTANPTRQNTDARVNVTAARAEALRAALETARNTFKTRQETNLKAKTARDLAVTALRAEMTGLLGELDDLLAADDSRWLAFGAPLPGTDHVPDRPEHLVLTAGAPGEVNADWADTARAERYHVEAQIVGVDAEFQRLLTRGESDATLTGLPAGQTVKVRILAVNAVGPSAPGEVVEIKVA